MEEELNEDIILKPVEPLSLEKKLTKIWAQFKKIPSYQKGILLFIVIFIISLLYYAFTLFNATHYSLLFNNTSPNDLPKITAILDNLHIPYHVGDDTTELYVPQESIAKAKMALAAQHLPKSQFNGFELLDEQKFGISQFKEHINYQRALEGELSRSIGSLEEVTQARVHLAIPKNSSFLIDQQHPTASVIIRLNHPLTSQQIMGIQYLVSSSVQGMSSDDVSIIDDDGNLLSQNIKDPLRRANELQLSYIHTMEHHYEQRIYELLEPITGVNNVRVTVTADIDFSQVEEASEQYDPNQEEQKKSIRSEQLSNSKHSTVGGTPGPAGNTTIQTSAGEALDSQQNTSTKNYELNKKVQYHHNNSYRTRRLTIAILVNDQKLIDPKTAEQKNQPWSATDIQNFEKLAKEATGFNEKRGDSIQIINKSFREIQVSDTKLDKALSFISSPGRLEYIKNSVLSLLLLASALYLIFLIFAPSLRIMGKKIQKSLSEASFDLFKDTEDDYRFVRKQREDGTEEIVAIDARGQEITQKQLSKKKKKKLPSFIPPEEAVPAYEEIVIFMRELAKEKPKHVYNIIRHWLDSDDNKPIN